MADSIMPRARIGVDAAAQSFRHGRLGKNPSRRLRQPVIVYALGLSKDLFDVRAQARLAPVVSRCSLGKLRLVDSRGVEQRSRGCRIERRIVALGKVVM